MNLNYFLMYLAVNQLNLVLSLQQSDISSPLEFNSLSDEMLFKQHSGDNPVDAGEFDVISATHSMVPKANVTAAWPTKRPSVSQGPTKKNFKQIKSVTTRVRELYAKRKPKNNGIKNNSQVMNLELKEVSAEVNPTIRIKRIKRQGNPLWIHPSRQPFYMPQQQPQPNQEEVRFSLRQQQQLGYPQRPASYQNGNNIIDTRLNPWHFHITLVSPNPEPLPAYHDLLVMARQLGPFNYGRPNINRPPVQFS